MQRSHLSHVRSRRRALRFAAVSAAFIVIASGLFSPAPRARPILERRVIKVASGAVGAGWQKTVDTGGVANLVGFEWRGAPAAEFQVRARRGATWSAWTDLDATGAEGPDTDSREFTGRRTAGPVWVGHGVRTIEVKVSEGKVEDLRVHAIRSEDAGTRGSIRAAHAAAVITRGQWGADESKRRCPQEYGPRVAYAVVHHTAHGADANNYGPSDSASIVRGIYAFHTDVNGWCDIGYNFLVDKYGQVFEGRFGGMLSAVVGAHAAGFNTESTGVALLGEFTSVSLPGEGFNALADLLAWKLGHHGVNPNTQIDVVAGPGSPRHPPGTVVRIWTITSHRDVGSTACPGDRVYERLPALRPNVAARMGGAFFSAWESLGGVLTATPAVTSGASGRLDLAVRGTNDTLWQKTWSNAWTPWTAIGGTSTAAPALTSWGPGRVDLFVRGAANELQHRWRINGAWSQWESLGGILTSDPAAVAWANGRIDVFARGLDDALWHTWYDGSWHMWESLGGVLFSAPAVASMSPGRLDVFVRGNDDALYQKFWSNGWSPWIRLGGVLRSAPAATSWGSGRVDVFVRGTDNAAWHKWWDGQWRSWVSRGGVLTSSPAAEAWGTGRIDVFGRGTDNALWHIWTSP